MAYFMGQYHHTEFTGDDSSYITPITIGNIGRNSYFSEFNDECITGLNLVATQYYLFTCQIKRMTSDQTFYVYLLNTNAGPSTLVSNQYVKTISVPGGDIDEWVPFEFLISPVSTFNAIVFQLARTNEDYRNMVRYPKIAYQQLGSINNLINRVTNYSGSTLLKIGVQSRPGLEMCINGEEIHISKTGIFEIREGIVPITFFSVVRPAEEVDENINSWKDNINAQIEAIENNPSLTPTQKEAAYAAINSRCFFGTIKNYFIDNFTLDYVGEYETIH